MTTEEKYQQEILFLQQKLEQLKKTSDDDERYMREQRLYGDIPRDEFGHQYKLLFHQKTTPTNRTELLMPDTLLGVAKDSKTLIFLQNDLRILHRFYDMGLRSMAIKDLFDNLFYGWGDQVRLTGILGGTERKLQSFFEPENTAYESFSFLERQKAKKERQKLGNLNLRKYIPKTNTLSEKKTYI